jgi:NAD(P)-dependent dehydrogenase (short-subunit alcohol dehydrogenase family)
MRIGDRRGQVRLGDKERYVQLDGQVAVITGGTRGIGFGMAKAFSDAGASVVLGGQSQDKGEQALKELDAGDRAIWQPCDVCVQADVEALVDEAVAVFGRLDILVNNAGGSDGFALVHEMTDEAWQKALAWNLNAVFFGTRRALRHMVAAGYGRIINISSVEGKQANKAAVSHYITNKHAINGLTKAVAFEYGPQGITCNAICKGAVETETMRELGTLAAQAEGVTYEQFLDGYRQRAKTKQLNTVEQVAAMALLLAGEHGGGITGATLNVDGGTAEW